MWLHLFIIFVGLSGKCVMSDFLFAYVTEMFNLSCSCYFPVFNFFFSRLLEVVDMGFAVIFSFLGI